MKKILLSITVVCVLASVLLACGCVQSTEETVPPEVRYAPQLETAIALADVMDARESGLMDAVRHTAAAVASDPENMTHVQAELSALFREAPVLHAIYFVNRTESVCAGVPDSPGQFQGSAVPSLNLSLERNASMTILHNPDNPSVAVPGLLVPVRTGDGTYLGVLVCAFDVSIWLTLLEEEIPAGTNWDCWILDDAGNVLVAPQSRLIGRNIWDLDAPDKAGLTKAFGKIYAEEYGVILYNTYSYTQLKLSDYVAAWDTVYVAGEAGACMKVVVMSELTEPDAYAVPIRSTNLSLEEFMYSARRFAVENGQTAALAEFGNKSGQFTTKEYYVYAMDDEVLLTHPYLPQMVGSLADIPDDNGVKVGQLLNRRAHQGGGYVLSQYPNPAADMQNQMKVNYVLTVNDSWYICAGFYLDYSGEVPVAEKESLMRYLRTVAAYAASVPMDEAVQVLNDPEGAYAPQGVRFFAQDYNGTVLADPQYPQYVGGNYMAMTDAYGSSLTRDRIILAKAGGGLQYVYVPLEDGRGASELRLEYVLPVNDSWLILASIPIV